MKRKRKYGKKKEKRKMGKPTLQCCATTALLRISFVSHKESSLVVLDNFSALSFCFFASTSRFLSKVLIDVSTWFLSMGSFGFIYDIESKTSQSASSATSPMPSVRLNKIV